MSEAYEQAKVKTLAKIKISPNKSPQKQATFHDPENLIAHEKAKTYGTKKEGGVRHTTFWADITLTELWETKVITTMNILDSPYLEISKL